MPNLLAVDDEPSILHYFRRALQVLEVTLRTASTAAEGVEAVKGRNASLSPVGREGE